jgi:hypothetical protein
MALRKWILGLVGKRVCAVGFMGVDQFFGPCLFGPICNRPSRSSETVLFFSYTFLWPLVIGVYNEGGSVTWFPYISSQNWY